MRQDLRTGLRLEQKGEEVPWWGQDVPPVVTPGDGAHGFPGEGNISHKGCQESRGKGRPPQLPAPAQIGTALVPHPSFSGHSLSTSGAPEITNSTSWRHRSSQ